MVVGVNLVLTVTLKWHQVYRVSLGIWSDRAGLILVRKREVFFSFVLSFFFFSF